MPTRLSVWPVSVEVSRTRVARYGLAAATTAAWHGMVRPFSSNNIG